MDLFSSSADSSPTEQEEVHRILCYGDSLTAGTSTSPWELYPYAPHLEQALNNQQQQPANSSGKKKRFVVRHRGMPGWTATEMVDGTSPQYGLRAAIRGIQNPSLSCVILLAGTNDLGYVYSDNDDPVETVLKPIRQLHELAWQEGIPRTVAIAIPPSGYQARVADASFLCTAVNQALESFCQEHAAKATFVPFPFDYDASGDNWSPDGLHFSPTGYQVLGQSLAGPVLQLFSS